ncbi:alkylation response protein AidB-like acyl-CoA dehydrogenase [Paractinoplanes brasiliensis]|uniref:Alkylation response protein AidB-like acyl-CoA dehydrogenase n=1 Tax=Paractinoplanes brasiliensis TaxID=52695 RepID=A0A4R6JLF1_9ACTN|nr:alkylation response protein AidB-like acyl-CoA dehydrogenase [Actinoplanes brasiliensis]GID32175.1 hypothetical protein Abr02nite_71580 [Actinoplanes brasiliensis]
MQIKCPDDQTSELGPASGGAGPRPGPFAGAEPTGLAGTLSPLIEEYRERAEKLGKMPDHLLEALISEQAFRLYSPRDLGGFEASPVDVLAALEQIARIDGPTAWILWSLNMGFIADRAGEAVSWVWGMGPDPLIAYSRQAGRIEAVAGGYRLSGQWEAVPGARLADWLLLCAHTDEGDPRFLVIPRGSARTAGRTGKFPAWMAYGRVTVDDVFVPIGFSYAAEEAGRLTQSPYRWPTAELVRLGASAVVAGVARSALDLRGPTTPPADSAARLAAAFESLRSEVRTGTDIRALQGAMERTLEAAQAALNTVTDVSRDDRSPVHEAARRFVQIGTAVLGALRAPDGDIRR